MKYLLGFVFTLFLTSSFITNAKAQATQLPDFSFVNTDEEKVGVKDIPKGEALLLIYFRTECDHCRQMAQQLKQTADKYHCEIWMVSVDNLDDLSTFEYMTGLMDVDNVSILYDEKEQIHNQYDFSYVPFLILFDKNKKEIKRFDELPNFETVNDLIHP